MQPKDYLEYENKRNKSNSRLYIDIMKCALGEGWDVLVGHHILYQFGGDVTTENEVPAADTLMFDHDIMRAVFGGKCIEIMQELVCLTCDERDEELANKFYAAYPDAPGAAEHFASA